jgi:hypothetical protein
VHGGEPGKVYTSFPTLPFPCFPDYCIGLGLSTYYQRLRYFDILVETKDEPGYLTYLIGPNIKSLKRAESLNRGWPQLLNWPWHKGPVLTPVICTGTLV